MPVAPLNLRPRRNLRRRTAHPPACPAPARRHRRRARLDLGACGAAGAARTQVGLPLPLRAVRRPGGRGWQWRQERRLTGATKHNIKTTILPPNRGSLPEVIRRENPPPPTKGYLWYPPPALNGAEAGGAPRAPPRESCVSTLDVLHAMQPGASTTLKPTSTFKRAVYHA